MIAAAYQPAAVQPLVDAKANVQWTNKDVSVWDVLFCLSVCVGDRVMIGTASHSHHQRVWIACLTHVAVPRCDDVDVVYIWMALRPPHY